MEKLYSAGNFCRKKKKNKERGRKREEKATINRCSLINHFTVRDAPLSHRIPKILFEKVDGRKILPRNFARGIGRRKNENTVKRKKSGKNVAKSGDLEGDKRGGGGAQAKLERIQLDLVASCILPFQCLSARYRRRRFAAGTRTRYTRVPTRSRIAYLAFYDPRAGPKSPFQRNWNREPTRPILEPIDKRSGTGVARAFLFPTIAVSPSLFPCSTLLSCIFSRLSLVTRFKRIEIESSSNPPKFSINNS